MIWIIIGLAVAVILGPILYLIPTARDRRLVTLREQARRAGLNVKIRTVEKLDATADDRVSAGGVARKPKRDCVAYQLPVGHGIVDFGHVLLVKIPAQPTLNVREVLPGWSLSGDSSLPAWQKIAGQGGLYDLLVTTLGGLPADTVGCVVDGRYVACLWLEKGDPNTAVVDGIKARLEALRKAVEAAFGVSEALPSD